MRAIGVICDAKDRWKFAPLQALNPSNWRLLLVHYEDLDEAAHHALLKCDVVFHKAKRPTLLRLLAPLEILYEGLFINPLDSVRQVTHRKQAQRLALEAGARVPEDFEGPIQELPFDRCVIKTTHDLNERAALPYTKGDRIELPVDELVFAQRWIQSEWEHKVYVIGQETFTFRQKPTLEVADKLSTRQPWSAPAAIRKLAMEIVARTGLLVGGVDFLEESGDFYVTDINSTQGLQNFSEGYPSLMRLIAKRSE